MWLQKSAVALAIAALAVGCERRAEERAEIAAERAEERAETTAQNVEEDTERGVERAEQNLEREDRELRSELFEEEEEEPSIPSEPMAELQRPSECVDPNDPACIQLRQQQGVEDVPPSPGTAQTQQAQQAQTQRAQTQQAQTQQAQQHGTPATPTAQLIERETEGDISRTVMRLNRQLRANNFEVLATVRYDQSARQQLAARLERERTGQMQPMQGQAPMQGQTQPQRGTTEQQRGTTAQQPGMTGQRGAQQGTMGSQQGTMAQRQQPQQPQQQGTMGAQAGEIGDVRLVLFRRSNIENQILDHHGISALLESPRQIVVYERGEKVVIAYPQPSEVMPPAGEEESTAQLLERITTQVTEPEPRRQQPTAQTDVQGTEQGTEEQGIEGEESLENVPSAQPEGGTRAEAGRGTYPRDPCAGMSAAECEELGFDMPEVGVEG
jgi:uncharacterized protein (DUF302 family)